MAISGPSFSGLHSATQSLATHSERVASGQRINSASDDAAGSAISERLDSQIRGYDQSMRNANDGISLLQTGSAALEGVTESVQRLRELALQASNGTLNDNDRYAINKEAQALKDEINRVVDTTNFNGKPLLSETDSLQLQVGQQEGDTLSVDSADLASVLSSSGFNDIDFGSAAGASEALSVLDSVQTSVDGINANFGASINRLDSTINSLSEAGVNAAASQSRISDADMAKEISDMVNAEVQRDVSLTMQAMSNQQKSGILRLLQ